MQLFMAQNRRTETDAPEPDVSPAPVAAAGSNSARARASAAGPYLVGLNEQQRHAVESVEGPVLVLAGAGTGKTRVLTTRIAHLLATGRARGGQILAVTFTNKAAREMKARVGDLIGGAVEGMAWLGTFHSIGVKILRRHAELAGLKSGFTILDTDDQIRLLKQVIAAADLDKDRWPARQLAGLIDTWKNRGQPPDQVPKGDSFAFANGRGAELYAAYQKRLRELNACDFGDLLLECLQLLRQHADVLDAYRERFRYIMVDEYQDTNTVQYLWLKLLAHGPSVIAPGQQAASEVAPAPGPNICCVGDDDQSIYGWRGAEVDNILRFEADFPGATVIRLERNYRSTGHILAAASGLIAVNQGRLGKNLFTDGAAGEQVTVSGMWDDTEEARVVGDDIEALKASGHSFNEMAILVRASFQMRAFEDRFVTLGLPYRVVGGPRFYERQEIKDAIAYLEVVANPANDLKFERIVNVPKRGLGDTSVKRIMQHARSREIPLTLAADELVQSEELPTKARRALAGLVSALARWRGRIPELRHTELAELVLDESGYTAMWQADKSPQADSRLENLKELIRFMDEFDSLTGFLEHVALVMDADTADDGERVSLMTLHAAKGLEFETVFLPGWEEGLFPHQRSLDENGLKGLEEERRLAYVGLTRARARAKVSFTENRRMRGLFQSATPSRFVDELPEPHVEVVEPRGPFSGAYRGFGSAPYGASRFSGAAGPTFKSSYQTPGWQRAQNQVHRASDAAIGGGPAAGKRRAKGKAGRPPLMIEGELVAKSTALDSPFKCGDRVFHEKFGYGQVTLVDGNKLTVAFDKAGQKRVVDSFVEPA